MWGNGKTNQTYQTDEVVRRQLLCSPPSKPHQASLIQLSRELRSVRAAIFIYIEIYIEPFIEEECPVHTRHDVEGLPLLI